MIRTASLLSALLACGACLAQPAAPAPVNGQRAGVPWARAGEHGPARDASNIGRTDRKFIEAAAQSGLAEIALGQLALQRARDPRLRDYARHLVADHQASNAQLQQITAARGLALPTQPARNQLSGLRDLQRLSGDAFDQHFLDAMVRDHQKAMDLFNQEIKGRHEDGDLKNFAQTTVIVLQRHYAEAQQLRKASGHLPG
jgi:putative membrane protein